MLKTDEAFKGIVLRGVAEEYDTAFLAKHLVEGRLPDFASSEPTNDILVSALTARELGLKSGQRVFAYFSLLNLVLAVFNFLPMPSRPVAILSAVSMRLICASSTTRLSSPT